MFGMSFPNDVGLDIRNSVCRSPFGRLPSHFSVRETFLVFFLIFLSSVSYGGAEHKIWAHSCFGSETCSCTVGYQVLKSSLCLLVGSCRCTDVGLECSIGSQVDQLVGCLLVRHGS